MTLYRCQAMAADGRSIWRKIEAVSRQAAVAQLASERLIALTVQSGRPNIIERLNQPIKFGRTLGVAEQALTLSQLATLLASGLPVDRSLDLLREQATRAFQRDVLTRLGATVRAGGGLAAGFEEVGCFPRYVVGILRSAERAGNLPAAMNSVADRLSTSADLRSQLITTLSYPAAVLVASFLALALVLTFVIPEFAPIFAGEEARLPMLTRWVLALSNTLNAYPLMVVGATLLSAAVSVVAARSLIDSLSTEWRHRLPGLKLRDDFLAGQFLGVLGTLIANGVTVVAALPLARSAIGSDRWLPGLLRVEQDVREGTRLSRALIAHALLPTTATRLIEVGEQGGGLESTCLQASAIIARSTKARIERIVAIANPIAIVLLGGVVGGLVGGVMLGIFSIGDLAG